MYIGPEGEGIASGWKEHPALATTLRFVLTNNFVNPLIPCPLVAFTGGKGKGFCESHRKAGSLGG